MIKSSVFLFLVIGLLAVTEASRSGDQSVSIKRFSQSPDGSNQYLIWNEDTYILVDAGFGDVTYTNNLINEMIEFGATIDNLAMIFITHAHPDHYGGVPILARHFPNTLVTVADTDIRNDLVNSAAVFFPNSTYGWRFVNVYGDSDKETLNGLGLVIRTGFPRAESEHYSMLRQRDDNWVITGDALYIGVHPYLGPTIDEDALINWYNFTLNDVLDINGAFGLDTFTFYYPGHGLGGANDRVKDLSDYLQEFHELLLFCRGSIHYTLPEIKQKLIDNHPNYVGADLLDLMVQNPNWARLQVENPCPYESSMNSSSLLGVSLFLMFFVLMLF